MNVPEKLELPVVVKDTDGNEHEVERLVYRLERDCKSRWAELFGTPERAARTLELLHVEWSDWCAVFSECCDCMFGQVDGERVTCWEPDDFSLVEWLRGDS